ncbi:SCO1/SenC-domain-containing protein [Macrophomina phaseolina]|uniref:SCO1/SenC-domain-containing protein n=1 Tax=Macrophomina phaseolina TaxID=35725 RepID=A0ABQ8GJS0_9PEZI|nr:SCO1/SenC-domain-containing protein [Macrophomina phaseolina]
MASFHAVRPSAWTAAARSAARSNNVAYNGPVRRTFNTPRCFNASSKRSYSCENARISLPTASTRATPRGQAGAWIQARPFSSTPCNYYKTVEEAKSRYRLGPFSMTSAVLFFAVGAGLIVYFRYEKERVQRQRIAEQTKGVGRPKVGGDFSLVDHNGNKFTSEDMKGKYALVYFGFTHCPDICPEELDKMAEMIDEVKKVAGNTVRPIFITCDPARDTPAVMKTYLREFHPDIIGLTGSYDDIKNVCKKYRVYFSTPPDVKPGQDYLVDHSIYFYLMDPEGDFVEALGRNQPAPQAAKIIINHVGDWRGKLDRD